ncbi:MAG: glycosyltransferase [Synechococcaceae cyanobacterium]
MAASAAAPTEPSVSCLVVSRTAALLNRLVVSLRRARRFWHDGDELLVSWNGDPEEEARVLPAAAPPLRMAQRSPYHFASNINALVQQARGDLVVLLNDDLILDPGSLDRAIQILLSRPDTGVVGGRLRTSDGRLGHAGILFSNQCLPYNRFRPDRLGHLIDPDDLAVQESGAMPAVTGALMVMRRDDVRALRLRENFSVCGEDVALCLDLRHQLGKHAYYASDVTAIHDEKSTRGDSLDHYDLLQVARLVEERLRLDPALRARQAYWSTQEADVLEAIVHRLREENARSKEDRTAQLALLHRLENDTARWKQESEAELAWLQGQLDEARARKQESEAELAWLQGQLDGTRARLELVERSRSWRLTAPCRRLGRWLQGRRPSS